MTVMSAERLADYVAALARIEKETRCRIDGVGAAVVPTLFGCVETQLIGLAALAESSSMSFDDALGRFATSAALMRAGWSADAFVLICEAFVGVGAAEDMADLAGAFASGNTDVHECLLTIAVTTGGESIVLAFPYRYELGRRIIWQPPLDASVLPSEAVVYLAMLDRALEGQTVPMPPDTEAAVNAIAEIISESGFLVQTFANIEIP